MGGQIWMSQICHAHNCRAVQKMNCTRFLGFEGVCCGGFPIGRLWVLADQEDCCGQVENGWEREEGR